LESGDALALLLALSEDVNRFADKINGNFWRFNGAVETKFPASKSGIADLGNNYGQY